LLKAKPFSKTFTTITGADLVSIYWFHFIDFKSFPLVRKKIMSTYPHTWGCRKNQEKWYLDMDGNSVEEK
jgi:hypothetical protein